MVKVSVVTIVKDHASGLARTHESLLGQDFVNWEMVIVVGASNDESLPFARELQLNDSRVRVIEQNGLGIYGAMNEGLTAATGEYIWFMNAGDRFASALALSHATGELEQRKAGMIIGGYQLETNLKAQTNRYPDGDVSILGFAFNRRGGCHQAMLFRRDAINAVGGFSTNYSLAGDFDLVLKVIKNEKAIRVSEVYALIEPGGRADQGIFLVHKQKHQIRKERLGGPHIVIASMLWTCLARIKIISRRATSSRRIV